jgi:hypothetical protein
VELSLRLSSPLSDGAIILPAAAGCVTSEPLGNCQVVRAGEAPAERTHSYELPSSVDLYRRPDGVVHKSAPSRERSSFQPGFDLRSMPQEGLERSFLVFVFIFIVLSLVIEVIVVCEQRQPGAGRPNGECRSSRHNSSQDATGVRNERTSDV